ncbi:PUTATIVE PERIPLASMIC PROTEIN [Pseudoalteromonas luteoviolacea B = ATCC 29581]|nr:PUTATIVE PERIPLASMIC PROTEIN [Pseudoalteromonas luteoviolacea B = ATCC 29581]
MQQKESQKGWMSAAIIGLALCLSAWILKGAALSVKNMERTVVVKGLAEQEVHADTVIWPLVFREGDNDLVTLIERVESKNQAIKAFLLLQGFAIEEISSLTPSITDKLAQEYVSQEGGFRYIAKAGLTLYSTSPEKVKLALKEVGTLAKQGIAITENYDNRIEYLYTDLNGIKPEMVQQATKEARQVAEKFALDSESKLGKIKQASQGQFSIRDRDSNTPEIKIVRVVTSVEYYLSD